MTSPFVSVLMTAYNRAQYIAEAIQSVLSSTYTDFELIIVDDGSTDDTVSIAESFVQKDSRVKLFVNPKNLGQFANRNFAASLASGDYLKYFDSDDVMYPQMLETMVDGMSRFPHAGIGAVSDWSGFQPVQLPMEVSSRAAYINHYFKGCTILFEGPSSVIYRRDVFFQCGMFDENIGILADTLLSLKIAAVSTLVAFKKDLYLWRVHDEQVTVGQQNQFEMIRERYLINEKILALPEIPFTLEERRLVKQNFKSIFLRNLKGHVAQIKSPSKIVELFKLYEIAVVDFFKALQKNKIVAQ